MLRVGTRGSALALVQTHSVIDQIKNRHPEISIQVITLQTSGDVFKGKSLAEAGGKGLFVKELEEALLRKEIDFAIHSLKDIPGILLEGLALAAFPKREDPRDCFISKKFASFEKLPKGAKVGTESPRRRVQILHSRSDLVVESIRGNVDTRLQKLADGNYDAIILAAAGLKRLNRLGEVSEFFDPDFLIPAVGQGILGIETRKEDADLVSFLGSVLSDLETTLAANAERAFLETIGGDCFTPLAAHAVVSKKEMILTGWLANPEGTKSICLAKKAGHNDSKELGVTLAKEILHALAAD